jgi:hypothetical protein
MTKIIIVIALLWLSLAGLDLYFLPNKNLPEYFSNISGELRNGLLLALIVSTASKLLEETRAKKASQDQARHKISILVGLLKNTFRRRKSGWNFRNESPSFYFDSDWINPLYDLLTHNSREWEVFLQEYNNRFANDNDLIEALDEFIKLMDNALINGEKLDSTLRDKIIAPTLAASLSSGFKGDRLSAKSDAQFSYQVSRAAWAGANSTEILLSIPLFTDQQLLIEKVERIYKKATSQDNDQELKNLINSVVNAKKRLSKQVTKIRRLLNAIN